jgi:hypothetical protein
MAAYDLNQDKIYGHIKMKKDRTTFLEFCRYLRTLYPPERPHRHRDGQLQPAPLDQEVDTRVGDWAKANNVELAYVPTNASWLNRIEAQFQALALLHPRRHRPPLTRRAELDDPSLHHAWRNRNAHDKTLRELVKRANVA